MVPDNPLSTLSLLLALLLCALLSVVAYLVVPVGVESVVPVPEIEIVTPEAVPDDTAPETTYAPHGLGWSLNLVRVAVEVG
ncbi:MAG: hypothetical protein GXY36_01545 [Chloroflexi bacterium]|nr:hypothetical protein [Chloroflexota bacterium]